MKNFHIPAPFFGALFLVLLAGCATMDNPVVKRDADPLAQPHAAVVGQTSNVDGESIEAAPEAGPSAQITTGTGNVIKVQASIDNPQGLLRTGMAGRAKVLGESMPVWKAFTMAIVRFVQVQVWSWIP